MYDDINMKMISEQLSNLAKTAKKIQNNSNTISKMTEINGNNLMGISGSLFDSRIIEVMKNFSKLLEKSSFQTFENFVSINPVFEAGNISLLKLDKEFRTLIDPPQLITNRINRLSSVAAKELLNSSLTYDNSTGEYSLGDIVSNVNSINSIAPASALFDEIEFDEMYVFFAYICNKPTLGAMHETGKKIYRLIGELKKEHLTELKNCKLYRGRVLEKDKHPFSENEVRKAPYGVSQQGRFNSAGISAFYLSDSIEGVKTELRKHSRNIDSIQLATFSLNENLKLLDISAWNNQFTKYIGYPINPNGDKQAIQKEYLVANYVADCLKEYGVDGVVYKGGSGYLNYVFWDDTKFSYIPEEMKIF